MYRLAVLIGSLEGLAKDTFKVLCCMVIPFSRSTAAIASACFLKKISRDLDFNLNIKNCPAKKKIVVVEGQEAFRPRRRPHSGPIEL